jgi:xylulokinase
LGINIGHRREHITRAAYEGVSFSIRDVIHTVAEFQSVNEYVFVGGGTKSKLWIQILADVLGKGGIIPEYCDAAYGAALMAGHGVGIWDGMGTAERNLANSSRVQHNVENHEKYNGIFAQYMKMAGK